MGLSAEQRKAQARELCIKEYGFDPYKRTYTQDELDAAVAAARGSVDNIGAAYKVGHLPNPVEFARRQTNDELHITYAYTEQHMRSYAQAEVRHAVAAERERCAKVCESLMKPASGALVTTDEAEAYKACADAIRADSTDDMTNGMRVEVQLHGEESDEWHLGTVVKARKQWVEFDAADPLAPFIADESSIAAWRRANP